MGILKTGLKLVGSAALGATGLASTILRGCVNAAGMDELAEAIGTVQNKSFDTIQDMWTPDNQKNDEYYEAREEKHFDRADSARRIGESKRREYERLREKAENERG